MPKKNPGPKIPIIFYSKAMYLIFNIKFMTMGSKILVENTSS